MPNTTNFNFPTPADTDLVKDGAAAIRSLGNSIDTAFVDLKGGTTGQVLAKASNTDLDFTWSAADPLSILDAKGDLISATAADTPAILALGTNNQVLTVDTSTSTGLKWASPATGGAAFSSLATSTANNVQSVTLNFSAKEQLCFTYTVTAKTSSYYQMRLNGDTGTNYRNLAGYAGSFPGAATTIVHTDQNNAGIGGARIVADGTEATGVVNIFSANQAGYSLITFIQVARGSQSGNPGETRTGACLYKANGPITSITFFDAGSGINWTVAPSLEVWGGN